MNGTAELIAGFTLMAFSLPLCAADCLVPGDVCQLNPKAAVKGIVLTTDSLNACEEMLKSIRLNDNDGLIELVKAGHVYATKGGDGIRVLTVKIISDCGEGRITTGEFKAARVWTFQKWIVK
ncbi:MAG: hypothetical protein ACR2NN_11800 [Bryobacteraceae bacterium]